MAFLLLLLYASFLILRPQDFIPGLAGAPYMMIFLAGAFLLSWLGRRLFFRDVPTLALLGLLLVMMLSSVANGWAGGIVPILGNFGTIVIAYLVCAGLLRDGNRIRWFCLMLCLCTSVIVLHSVQQAETGIGWTGAKTVEGNRVTWVGIFNDPNDLGLLFLVAIPMLLMFAKLARGKLARLFWYGLTSAHVYGIWLTHSRGALLTLMLISAIAFYRRYGLSKSIFAGLLALPALLVVMSQMRAIETEEESAYGRIDAWYAGMEMFRANPVLGVGMDAFTEYHHLTAHNSYILVLAELGVMGYMAWTLMISAVMLMVWRATHGRLRPEAETPLQGGESFAPPARTTNRPVALLVEGNMILYAMIAYLSAAFFLSRSYIILLYVLCGMAVAYYHKVRTVDPQLHAVTAKSLTLFMVLLVPASVVLLYLMVRVLL